MFNDSDTIDDFLSPTETTTGRQLGKFRPKARAKTVKVVSASTKTSDVARDVSASLEPVALDSHSEHETEQAHLQTCTSSDFSHVMQVIKMVQEKAETSAKEETNDDQENASQCNVDTNEKEPEGIADEGDDYGGKDEDAGYPDFDEHEWDSCTYRREKEEDSIWDF
ncbi:uncharacterized protein LOC122030049 [Zingiber officinale]|uniref:uncharacterized protein LOC122030049 n=1 Tax=Zingiber officinale TaxID=94328 RepID=UPI001C4D5C8B|nr:uncharacterized protein LOC122030049 [Zingiber officinale]XP_042445133.1 uncharacterized protein LOC122030049 [Zingiber officinale]XP_042445134.1 uncharacterized protein LOC122030049 [Zingiber officinale]